MLCVLDIVTKVECFSQVIELSIMYEIKLQLKE